MSLSMRCNFIFSLPLPWKIFLFVALSCCYSRVDATHIVGAELTYECLNANTNRYQVRLRMLRDCKNGQAQFDDPIRLFVFSSLNPNNVSIVSIPRPLQTPRIVPEDWTVCAGNREVICVEEAIYVTTVTLPPITGGYDLGWARCCRNFNITNLRLPLTQGVTFLAHVPGPDEARCNSMPVFDDQLPTFICTGKTFFFDHSATDPDGDSLVYELSWPYTGLNMLSQGAGNPNNGGPQPVVNAQNPMGAPPYQQVTYSSQIYSSLDPFGSGVSYIDPQTGYLTFRADNPGVYVVAVSVKEYRNGVFLSENKVDLQIHAIPCLPGGDPPEISHDLSGLQTRGDTVIVSALDSLCYRVTVTDTNLADRLTANPVSAIFYNAGGGNRPTVSVSGSNPLFADICWQPGCEWTGDTVTMILAARDEGDCSNYNYVFDTVYVIIEPSPPRAPVIGYDLSSVRHNGDTIIAELDTAFCFDWWVNDTLRNGGPLNYSYVFEALDSGPGIFPSVSPDISNPDSIPFRVCWQAGCDQIERTFRLVMTGTDASACPPNNATQDTLYFYIPPPPNPPPLVNLSQNGNTIGGDTLEINVHDQICFEFSIRDSYPAVGLNYQYSFLPLDSGALGGAQPVFTITNQNDSLNGTICWTSSCVNADRLYLLVIAGIQENRCIRYASNLDSLYIRVNDLQNPPPVIGHSFLPGYQTIGDTIIIAADSTACFDFFLRDSIVPNFLSVQPEMQSLSGQPLNNQFQLNITTNEDTLIEGQICVVPGCENAGDTLQLVLTGRDTFDCKPSNWVYDTIIIIAKIPENQPPVISHSLAGLQVEGDKVIAIPNGEPYCYLITLEDPDPVDAALTAEGISKIFESWHRYGNNATLSISGSNPLYIEVCWDPSCYDAEQEFSIVVCGRDTSRCGLTPEVCDTVRFRIEGCSLELPNVFTPNGDGFNDRFIPYDVQGVEYYRLNIFDRWGIEVYAEDNGSWDGTMNNNGSPVPEGVYYYILEYQFWSARGVPLKEQRAGWLSLFR